MQIRNVARQVTPIKIEKHSIMLTKKEVKLLHKNHKKEIKLNHQDQELHPKLVQ